MTDDSLLGFMNTYQTEEDCLKLIESIRFKNGEYCPYCNCKKIYKYKKGGKYKCSGCQKQFSIKVGTIFESSKIAMKTWMICIHLMTQAKKGISSKQLARYLGVTQKTAWFMAHRIREGFYEDNIFFGKDTIQIDETYVGGKEKNKHKNKRTPNTQGRSLKTKMAVVGILSTTTRKIKAIQIDDVKPTTLKRFIDSTVSKGSTIFTDEFRSYSVIERDYKRFFVNHAGRQYVDGDATTNGLENFWSIFKRGYVGIYHFMSKKHLQKYVNEFVFRYNYKVDLLGDFLSKSIGRRLRYRELIYEK